MSSKIALISLLVLLTLGCSVDFDNNYQKIVDDRIRPLEFVQLSTDNAPGDTVTLQASFAGKQFDPTTIHWRVSWEFLQTGFNNGLYQEEDLAPYMIGTPTLIDSSYATRTLEFRFVIPDSIIINNSGIPDDWSQLVQYYLPDFDPDSLGLPSTKDSILYILDSVSAMSPQEQAQIPRIQGQVLNIISQMFTVQYELYAEIPNDARLEARYSCRYHGPMRYVNGVYANTPPTIDSFVIFKAAANLEEFHPAEDAHTTTSMRGDSLIIPLSGDSSYWLGVYALAPESTLTFEAAYQTGLASLESYNNYFFYEEKTFETINFVTSQAYYDETGFNVYKVEIDDAVKAGDEGLFWLTLIDERAGEANRPRGRYMRFVPILVE